jgi:hypothetical protein
MFIGIGIRLWKLVAGSGAPVVPGDTRITSIGDTRTTSTGDTRVIN